MAERRGHKSSVPLGIFYETRRSHHSQSPRLKVVIEGTAPTVSQFRFRTLPRGSPCRFRTSKSAMKRARFSEEQIITILKEAEGGAGVAELCRRHGISDATLYTWRSKYGGLEVSEMRRPRQLEEQSCMFLCCRSPSECHPIAVTYYHYPCFL